MQSLRPASRWVIGFLAGALIASTAGSAEDLDFSFGGYIKLDALLTDYSGGVPTQSSALRDFYIPGAVPVGDPSGDAAVDFHTKESRFNFTLEKETDGGHQLRGYLELDFLLSASGDERVSNSYNPRLRHAYFSYDKWLFGQTWSTFMIVVLPEDLDFIGVADGTTFRRGPQIRLTQGPWQFSVENPETTITPNGGGDRLTADRNSLPDIVGRYNAKRDWGSVSAAGIFRRLDYDDGSGAVDDNGWGVSVGGKLEAGKRDGVVFMVTTGSGLGRHLALNTANAAALTVGGDLEAIDSTAGFVGLRHRWNDRWRSSVNVSGFEADNNAVNTGTGVTRRVHSYSVNLLCSPVPEMTVGVEYMHAERELESGTQGDLDRFQFSAKYAFKYSPTRR